LGSYKRVNGVYFPFSIESGSERSPGNGLKTTITKMEANVAIPDSEFKMPVEPVKTAAPPPPAANGPGNGKSKLPA
jgi:hypothetical protein